MYGTKYLLPRVSRSRAPTFIAVLRHIELDSSKKEKKEDRTILHTTTVVTHIFESNQLQTMNEITDQQTTAIDASDDLTSQWEDALSSISEQSSFKQQALMW